MKADFQENGTVVVTMTQSEFFTHFGNEQTEERKTQQPVTSNDLAQDVTTILSHIGIPRNIFGFGYLREAIILSVGDQEYINKITGMLYPAIAQKFDTSPNRVERAIRHAIETYWGDHAMKTINMYCGSMFKPGSRKPTNSEFIALIADCFRLRLKKRGGE